MHVSRANVWRGVKAVLAVLIIGGVAWQFAKILGEPRLWEKPLRPAVGGLAVAVAAHIAAVSCWGRFWYRLLRQYGEKIAPLTAAFAYFASQLGKYVPGKALAIVLRVAFARAAGVRTSVAAITALYETLTSMAAGALLAAILLPLLKSDHSALDWRVLGLWRWLACRSCRAFSIGWPVERPNHFCRPTRRRCRARHWHVGIRHRATAVGWFFLGASLLAVLWAIRPDATEITARFWLSCTSYVRYPT